MEFLTASLWFLVIGGLLILMAFLRSFVERLPISTGLIYLIIGIALGPAGVNLLHIDPYRQHAMLERVFEIVVLISLFTVGLKLRIPFSLAIWRVPIRLAGVAMVLTIAALTLVGVLALGLSWGAAILLAAILAPTDPVLASDVQMQDPLDRDRLRFSLTAEGGLNDGTAFPFVFLGLGLLGLRDLGAWAGHWLLWDLLWAPAGGLLIGWLCGQAIGRVSLWIRYRFRQPPGMEEFLTLGLIALSYGLALITQTLGFMAVLAAGVAMRHLELRAQKEAARQSNQTSPDMPETAQETAQEAAEASADMVDGVLIFNERTEHLAEVVAVLLLGGLLSAGYFTWQGLWMAALLFLVVRPVAALYGVMGIHASPRQRILTGWFGVRGVGSLYYLMFALTAGIPDELARQIVPLVLTIVAASIVVHGISATPLMRRYARAV